nr:MAG: ORF1 [Torque teno midi virus]
MPFWWKRRRRPWFGRYRYRRPRKYQRRRRYITRRRGRRTARRRRRRRRYKVRRKRKQITIKQWQPESIRKCKIKGFGCLVLGGQGTQFLCFTNEADNYVPPKVPSGGGFGSEVITLEYLYKQYKAHNCVWTASNNYKDLCRYTGCTITLFRHPTTDFVFSYSIMPPFTINQFTYPDIHPQNLLLRKHHRVILSQASKPNGKVKVKVKIKPPKQMISKWFFQRQFADVPLVLLQASAASFTYPRIGQLSASQLLTINYLNPEFWGQADWAQYRQGPYLNIATGTQLTGTYTTRQGTSSITVPPSLEKSESAYYSSINIDTGWFNTKFLNSFKITKNNVTYAHLPMAAARYNPNEDTGEGNEVWLTSVVTGHFTKPSKTPDYLIQGLPLWMAFYGFWNYLQYTSKDKNIFSSHMFVVRCKAIKPMNTTITSDYYPFVDKDFVMGKLPYDEYISDLDKKLWYPTAKKQIITINQLVQCGPFIPRYDNVTISTWELNYSYKFYFKWGGPTTTDPPCDDPKTQGLYDVPDTVQKAIQILNPKSQKPETMFHEWDYRRGFITSTALKRMQQNLETDSSVQSDSEPPKKKKKITKEMPYHREEEEEIKSCLLSLCESDSSQEKEEDIQAFIHKQQLKQHKLRRNILKLLRELKSKQQLLQLQTGVLD